MSSAGRIIDRQPDDHYGTAGWVTRAILPRLGPLAGRRILEPQAGRGSIVRELLRAGATDVVAVEKNDEHLRALCAPDLAGEQRDGSLCPVGGDFLLCRPEGLGGLFDLAVMNPPFLTALEHLEHAISMLTPEGECAALLRLAFQATPTRRAFRAAHPFDVFPLESRPSFTGEALAWMTEEELLAAREKVKAKPKTKRKPRQPARLETLDEVRARFRRTDSADYAWYLFPRTRVPGKVYSSDLVLEGKGGS